jgi:hypothetical protein
MKKRLTTNGSILGYFGAASVAVLVSITVMITIGWRKPAAASHANPVAAAHSLPHWMMAAGLLGSPAMTPNPAAPSGNAYTGVADYPTPGSYSFTVPEGVTTVLVQFYGGGGGGGSAGAKHYTGGGGAGAYVMSIVTVTPGATYTINVGAGGPAGALGEPGGIGGNTSLVDPTGTVIVAAGGGQGGRVMDEGGAGGQPIGSPMIGRAGLGGEQFDGGSGYTLPALSYIISTVSSGGPGQNSPFNPAASGSGGYAFIAW